MLLIDFILIVVSLICALIGAGLVMLLIWMTYKVMSYE